MRARFPRTPLAALIVSPSRASDSFGPGGPLRDWSISGRGDHAYNVTTIQHLMRAHSCSLPVDSVFGRTTEKVLQQFQRAHHLVASRQTNNSAWESLLVPLRQGSKGPAVKAAQVELGKEGYAVAVDGIFGPQMKAAVMKAAVRKLQSRTGHTADGIVGRNTWYELVGGNEPPEAD